MNVNSWHLLLRIPALHLLFTKENGSFRRGISELRKRMGKHHPRTNISLMPVESHHEGESGREVRAHCNVSHLFRFLAHLGHGCFVCSLMISNGYFLLYFIICLSKWISLTKDFLLEPEAEASRCILNAPSLNHIALIF